MVSRNISFDTEDEAGQPFGAAPLLDDCPIQGHAADRLFVALAADPGGDNVCNEGETTQDDLSTAKGILLAVLMSVPIWAMLFFSFW